MLLHLTRHYVCKTPTLPQSRAVASLLRMASSQVYRARERSYERFNHFLAIRRRAQKSLLRPSGPASSGLAGVDTLLCQPTIRNSTSSQSPDRLLLIFTVFTSVFPVETPRYAMLVMLDEAKADNTGSTREAGWNAAVVTGQTIDRVAPILGVVPVLASQ